MFFVFVLPYVLMGMLEDAKTILPPTVAIFPEYSDVLKQLPKYPNSNNLHLVDIWLGHHGTLCEVG